MNEDSNYEDTRNLQISNRKHKNKMTEESSDYKDSMRRITDLPDYNKNTLSNMKKTLSVQAEEPEINDEGYYYKQN